MIQDHFSSAGDYHNDNKILQHQRILINKRLKRAFDISIEDYEKILNEQENKCAICKTSHPGGHYQRFAVDHSHDTCEIRGLLCSRCNIGIGKFEESIEIFNSAIEYLQNYHKKQSVTEVNSKTDKNKIKAFERKINKRNIAQSKKRKGEEAFNHKLTEIQVREIKLKFVPYLYGAGRLAREYKVDKSTIQKILKK